MPDLDDPVEPLTTAAAERLANELLRNATGTARDVMQLAEAHRDAANRVATLESENHDLRTLLGLVGERGAAREALTRTRHHAQELARAARDLEDTVD